jgi:hypothetical protein
MERVFGRPGGVRVMKIALLVLLIGALIWCSYMGASVREDLPDKAAA